MQIATVTQRPYVHSSCGQFTSGWTTFCEPLPGYVGSYSTWHVHILCLKLHPSDRTSRTLCNAARPCEGSGSPPQVELDGGPHSDYFSSLKKFYQFWLVIHLGYLKRKQNSGYFIKTFVNLEKFLSNNEPSKILTCGDANIVVSHTCVQKWD